jgi:hypothetical protein
MWTAIVRIIRALFRLLIGLFMAAVVAGAAYWVWGTLEDRRLERAVSVTREWKHQSLPMTIPLRANLKTRCSESRLYYQFQVAPMAKHESAKEAAGKDWASALVDLQYFVILLRDSDGFHIISVRITPSDLQTVVDDSGHPTASGANASTSCDRRAYARVTDWTVSWAMNR